MQYLKNNRGVTLVELLVTLIIGTMIVGLVFLIPQLFQQQNNYNESFNTAKNQVLLITNTLIERLEKADHVDISRTTTKMTITVNNTGQPSETFTFTQKASPEDYLYDVSYNGSDPIGTVGFYLEKPTIKPNTVQTKVGFFILTLWTPYQQSNSVEEKFVVTQGFHTAVVN